MGQRGFAVWKVGVSAALGNCPYRYKAGFEDDTSMTVVMRMTYTGCFRAGILLLIAYVVDCSAGARSMTHFPAVKQALNTFNVPDLSNANVVMFIYSQRNEPLYKLQCHSAGFEGDQQFDYTGDFECRLSSVRNRDKYSTLFTEDAYQSRDWESRGRFFASQLIGPCGRILQFGTSREFRLRRMKVQLDITEPQFGDDNKLKSLQLTVGVSPDDTARRAIAEAVPLPKQVVPEQCKLNEYFVSPSDSNKTVL